MSWVSEKLLGLRRVVFGGNTLPERGTLEFLGPGVSVTDNATTKRTEVMISGGGDSEQVHRVERGAESSAMATYFTAVTLPVTAATTLVSARVLWAVDVDHTGGNGATLRVSAQWQGAEVPPPVTLAEISTPDAFMLGNEFYTLPATEETLETGQHVVFEVLKTGSGAVLPAFSVFITLGPVEE